MVVQCQNSSSVGTTNSVANGAIDSRASGTFEITRLPASAGIGMTRVRAVGVKIEGRGESGASKKSLLQYR